MLSEIPSALAAINSVRELAKAVNDSKVDSALREQAIKSNFAISDALNDLITFQAKYQSLLQEKDELERRLMAIEDWNTEAANYTLTQMAPGVFVYAFKGNNDSATPPHWLCPNCYQAKKKSILQFRKGDTDEFNRFICPACKTVLIDHTGEALPRSRTFYVDD